MIRGQPVSPLTTWDQTETNAEGAWRKGVAAHGYAENAADERGGRDAVDRHATERIPELDGLRGIACLIVLAWHYVGATVTSTFGANVVHNDATLLALMPLIMVIGTSGVDLFFVLSGFLISGILMDNRESPRFFKTFYLRRICRIFPVYFLVYGLLLAALSIGLNKIGVFNKWLFANLVPLWSYPLFVQNILMAKNVECHGNWISMSWSVAVEEQFYLLLPLLIFLVPRQMVRTVVPSLCVIAIIISWVLRFALPYAGWMPWTLLACRLDALAAGILAAWAIRSPLIWEGIRKNKLVLMGAMAVCAAMVYLLLYHVPQLQCQIYFFNALLYVCLLLLILCTKNGITARICRNPLLMFAGTISYGIYMYHQAVQGLLHGWLRGQVPTLQNLQDAGVVALAVVTTLGIASISYFGMEKHFLKLGRRFRW